MKTKHARRIRYQILAAREDFDLSYDAEGRRLRATAFVRKDMQAGLGSLPVAYWKTYYQLLLEVRGNSW